MTTRCRKLIRNQIGTCLVAVTASWFLIFDVNVWAAGPF